MKIKSLHIQNFRSIEDQTIPIDQFTCFVGINGAGKSNVLAALNIFFRNFSGNTNIEKISEDDFHLQNTKEIIKIGVSFENLSDEAKDDFKAYVRQNELTIYCKIKWLDNGDDIEYLHFGSRNVIKAFADFFGSATAGAKVAELKEKYDVVKSTFPELPPAKTKEDMTSSLRNYEELHPDKCELLESTEQFYGWSKGTNRLNKYIQWVFIPAVKDASQEKDESKNSALGQLLQRTIRQKLNFTEDLKQLSEKTLTEYQTIVKSKDDVLTEISSAIQSKLQIWSHKRSRLQIQWNSEDKKSVQIAEPNAEFKLGEDDFLGDVSRIGHGLQRSFILALLQELSDSNAEEKNQTLILGFEEPELYQHPPQIRHMQSVLEKLALAGSQVLITTHNPLLVSNERYESVRRVCKTNGKTTFKMASLQIISDMLGSALETQQDTQSSILAKICQIMLPTLNEIYFCKSAILVEGIEDLAYLSSAIVLENKYDLFRNSGCTIIVCGGKTNISRPLAICLQLGIPAFVIFDSDSDCKPDKKEKNIRDNKCLLKLLSEEIPDYLPTANIFNKKYVMWSPNITKTTKAEYGEVEWASLQEKIREENNLISEIKEKNTMLISKTLEEVYASRKIPSLTSALTAIEEFIVENDL